MNSVLLLDLDMTLFNTSGLQRYRDSRQWRHISQNLQLAARFDGSPDAVARQLRAAGTRVGVVTSSPSTYAVELLRHFGMSVDIVVGYHDTKRRKPYPDPILHAVQKLGVSPSDVVYVGDDVKDIDASKAAGVVAVAALWGAIDGGSLVAAQPDVVIKTPMELSGFAQFRRR